MTDDGGVMGKEVVEIVRRLQPEWPGVDVASVVAAAYQRLAAHARITMYLPVLAEHQARTWLKEQRAAGSESSTGPLMTGWSPTS